MGKCSMRNAFATIGTAEETGTIEDAGIQGLQGEGTQGPGLTCGVSTSQYLNVLDPCNHVSIRLKSFADREIVVIYGQQHLLSSFRAMRRKRDCRRLIWPACLVFHPFSFHLLCLLVFVLDRS